MNDPELRPLRIGCALVLMMSDEGLDALQVRLREGFEDPLVLTGPSSVPVTLMPRERVTIDIGSDGVVLGVTPEVVAEFVAWQRPVFRNPLLPELGLIVPEAHTSEPPRRVGFVRAGPFPHGFGVMRNEYGMRVQTVGYAAEFGGNEISFDAADEAEVQFVLDVIGAHTNWFDSFGVSDVMTHQDAAFIASPDPDVLEGSLTPLLRMRRR